MWAGGKDGSGVAQRLINNCPPHETFIAAFLGDCALMRRKLPAAQNIGIDLDDDAIAKWEKRLKSFAAPLEIYQTDAVAWLRHRFALDLVATTNSSTLDTAFASTLVYVDPPYLLSTRSSGPMYRHELTDAQHVELVEVLLQLPCLVMVSHYPCELYNDTFAGWRSFDFQSVTRAGTMRTERVWSNYPEPRALHDSRYLGDDKRERERIKRRRRNWLAGLKRMSPLERQAVLDEIAALNVGTSGDVSRSQFLKVRIGLASSDNETDAAQSGGPRA